MNATTDNAIVEGTVRVIETTYVGFNDDQGSEHVKWLGTDTEELSTEYPPSDVFGADPLGIRPEIEDGLIRYRYRFEQYVNGEWQEVDDPRVRLTPITAYELAVEADNRRDFPGDYITVDCENCDDRGCEECDPSYYDDSFNCSACSDYGCAKCDPSWCTECDNEGCATCDPANVCSSCHRYIDPRYESLGTESGECQDCESEHAQHGNCTWCHYALTEQEASAGELCTSCADEVNRLNDEACLPQCNICSDVLTELERQAGELCASCIEEWKDDPNVFPPSPPWYIKFVNYIRRLGKKE